MAGIRKRNGKFEVQIRRTGQPRLSRSFIERKDARQWAHQMELEADRHDLPAEIDRKALDVTLGRLHLVVIIVHATDPQSDVAGNTGSNRNAIFGFDVPTRFFFGRFSSLRSWLRSGNFLQAIPAFWNSASALATWLAIFWNATTRCATKVSISQWCSSGWRNERLAN